MNPKTTAVLFVVAAALAAFVHFYEIGGEEARKKSEEVEKRLFPGVEQSAVESISIVASDGPSVSIERRGGAWQIVAPVDFAADHFAVDGIASALAQMTHESVIEEPSSRAVYGLDSEETEVRFSAGGVEYALRTGDPTPVGDNIYVSIDGDTRVFTVARYRGQSLRKPLDELRDKRIADFDQSAVKRFTASWPDGRVVVERSGEGWKLAYPMEGPADGETVDALLSTLALLRAEGFIDDPAPDLEAGFAPPEFAVEIEQSIMAAEPGEASGEAQAPTAVRVAIGGLDATATRRLVLGAESSLYTIPAAELDEFPRSLNEYRNRQLVEFPAHAATRVELGFHSEAGVSTAISAHRGAEGWTSNTDPIQAEKLANLVTEMSRLRADEIVADAMGPDELEAIGLKPPNVILSVFGDADPDVEDGADPLLAEIHIGDIRAQGIFARTPGRETIFELNSALAEHIPVNLEAFQNHFAASPAPDSDTDVEEEWEGEMGNEAGSTTSPD